MAAVACLDPAPFPGADCASRPLVEANCGNVFPFAEQTLPSESLKIDLGAYLGSPIAAEDISWKPMAVESKSSRIRSGALQALISVGNVRRNFGIVLTLQDLGTSLRPKEPSNLQRGACEFGDLSEGLVRRRRKLGIGIPYI